MKKLGIRAKGVVHMLVVDLTLPGDWLNTCEDVLTVANLIGCIHMPAHGRKEQMN